MIIPLTCKSCGKYVSHLWFHYLDLVEKEIKNGSEEPEKNALDKMGINRYCCRVMFLCQPQHLIGMIRNRVQ